MIEDRALDHNLIACFNGLVWVNGLRQNDAVECVSVCVCWRYVLVRECVFCTERMCVEDTECESVVERVCVYVWCVGGTLLECSASALAG